MSDDAAYCVVAIATYVQKELQMWNVDLGDSQAVKFMSTKLPELLSKSSAHRDVAVDADSIVNCIWISREPLCSESTAGIDVYLGSRSGMLHRLVCVASARAASVVDSWKLSDSPLEFVFFGCSEANRDELLIVGDGQWLLSLKKHQVQPVVASYQSFEGACNACTFRSPITPCGVIVSLRTLPTPFPSLSNSNNGAAMIIALPNDEFGAGRVSKVTNLSQLNINAACSHVVVLPRLSLTVVAAVVRNRASLLFISQGKIVHVRPLTMTEGDEVVLSLDAREDEGSRGGFTISVALSGVHQMATFNVGRGDFTIVEGSVDAFSDALGTGKELCNSQKAAQAGLSGGNGAAICLLRARVNSKIVEEEQFTCGSRRPAAANVELRIEFDEPFYRRFAPHERVQGVGVLSLAGPSSSSCEEQVVAAFVDGATLAFSRDNSSIEVQILTGPSASTYLFLFRWCSKASVPARRDPPVHRTRSDLTQRVLC
jgi:hypothetical protein